jgi:hypothetical protein
MRREGLIEENSPELDGMIAQEFTRVTLVFDGLRSFTVPRPVWEASTGGAHHMGAPIRGPVLLGTAERPSRVSRRPRARKAAAKLRGDSKDREGVEREVSLVCTSDASNG